VRRYVTIDRRRFGAGLAAGATLPLVSRLSVGTALAQTSGSGPWAELDALTAEAEKLGLSAPAMSLGPQVTGEGYNELLPAVIDFMDNVDISRAEVPTAGPEQVDGLLERASEILRQARNAERSPKEVEPDVEAPGAAPRKPPPTLEEATPEYRELFATCKIRDEKRSEVQWYVSKVTDLTRRKSYETVFEETCVPWFVVAIIHGMEGGFDWLSHIHNGDPLKNKTFQVPANRPDPWNPPSDWASSAVDAMKWDKLADIQDWTLPRMLYSWEKYNGWRSRTEKGIHTPYLWSYSNHYTKGKFVKDGVWDGNAVSKQCGAGVMLKALVEAGAIPMPA
jgi:lysozyme family protein